MATFSKRLFSTTLLFLLVLSPISNAIESTEQKIPYEFPKDFMYQGKPISPLCIVKFEGDSSRFDPINLATCSKITDYKITDTDKNLIDKGYIGFSYSVEGDFSYQGSLYYKILGQYKDTHVLYIQNSGGGSGYFTSIITVKRDGDSIKLAQEIAGGDRCNGGIAGEVELNKNVLRFSQHITPFDMLNLSQILSNKVKAYDDLAACAACCVGTAVIEHDFEKQKLISINLPKVTDNSMTTQGIYQPCLNNLINEYQKQNKFTLTLEELKELTTKFNNSCVKSN